MLREPGVLIALVALLGVGLTAAGGLAGALANAWVNRRNLREQLAATRVDVQEDNSRELLALAHQVAGQIIGAQRTEMSRLTEQIADLQQQVAELRSQLADRKAMAAELEQVKAENYQLRSQMAR